MEHLVADLKRNLRVVWRLWKISLQQNLEFRWQFVAGLIDEFFHLFFSIIMFEVAYAHTPSLGGWNKYQAILLVGVFQLYTIILKVFFWPNLGNMSRTIFQGDLDGLLLRPVSTQLLLSLRTIDVKSFLNCIPGLVVIAYALNKLNYFPSVFEMTMAVLLLMSGVVIVYSMWFISMTLEFWFAGMWAWSSFIPNLFDFAKYPKGIFKGNIKILFYTAVPIVVISNFPTEALTGDFSWRASCYSFGLAAFLVVLSHFQLKWALSRYTSASS